MIYVTGDIHGPNGINRLSPENWETGRTLTRNDYLIVCGDFGLVWDPAQYVSTTETYWTNWLNDQPWTTLFVDGNHENHPRLASYPVEEWHGGRIHRIAPNIIHLMRGEYYEIDGHTFWVFGGAVSIDKAYRTEGVSWWKEEMPTMDEMAYGLDNLHAHGDKVDFIITHCAPTTIQRCLIAGSEKNYITSFFDMVGADMDYKRWYFGHYHMNLRIDERFWCLYEEIVPVYSRG